MSKIPVWFDADTGVDDATALLLANTLDNLEIVGISCVAGNVPVDQVTENTLRICDLMKKQYSVFKGAEKPWFKEYHDACFFHGKNGIGDAILPKETYEVGAEKAWDALHEAALRYEGELEVIAVGPLTNIATAIVKYPDLKKLVKRVLIMGGAASGGNSTPAAEFNIYEDPHAAQTLFMSGIPVVMCGLDVTMKAYLTMEEIDEVHEHHTAVTDFYYACTRRSHTVSKNLGLPGLCVHDACPVLFAAHPELFKGEEAGVYVETQSELTLGKTVTDLYSDFQFPEKNAYVVTDIDREKFAKIMMDALMSYCD